MRGIVLAGGTGSRLGKVTGVVNKHLLQVYDRPMISWALKVLHDNGIKDVTIVSSPDGVGQIAKLLGSGFTYRVQRKPDGIMGALLEAEDKRCHDKVAVILGDNIFLPSPRIDEIMAHQACVYLKEVADPRQFGVARLSHGRVCEVVEKPDEPVGNLAVTGLYVFDSTIFSRLHRIVDNSGEYGLTSYLNHLAKSNALAHEVVTGFWGDAGTPDGLLDCANACQVWMEK